jgi:hypothetical protein
MKKFVPILIAVLFLSSCKDGCQDTPKQQTELLPGEINDPRYPVPIISAVQDMECSDSTACPSKTSDCVTRTFTVQKDTTYYLTVSYFNGDTIHPSCRACGTVYAGDSVVMHNVTACPTGGPWTTFGNLKPGTTYTLSVCLQNCPGQKHCDCGEYAVADAIVSLRRVFD